MSELFLLKTFHRYVTRDPDMDDQWDRGETSTDWEIAGLVLTRPISHKLRYNQDYEVVGADDDYSEGDDYYAVVAVWSTGDSFGWDTDYCCECFGVYKTEAEAEAKKKKLEKDKSHSVPWNGYFESLTDIEVLSGKIEKG